MIAPLLFCRGVFKPHGEVRVIARDSVSMET